MKKFLALLCTMAMVLSMFSGIVVAAVPAVTADDVTNMIVGANNTMEWATDKDNGPWTVYDPANAPTFRGNRTVYVRDQANPADITTLTFTELTGYISWWDTMTAGASDTLEVVVNNANGKYPVKSVVVDFSGSKFSVKNAGNLPDDNWTADVSGSKVTYTYKDQVNGWTINSAPYTDTKTNTAYDAENKLYFAPVAVNPNTAGVYAYPKLYINNVLQDSSNKVWSDETGMGYSITGVQTSIINNKENVINGQVKVNGVLSGDLIHVILSSAKAYPSGTLIADTYTNDGNFSFRYTPNDAANTRYYITAWKVDSDTNADATQYSGYTRTYSNFDWTATTVGTVAYDSLKAISGNVKNWIDQDNDSKLDPTQYAVVLVKKVGNSNVNDADDYIGNGTTYDEVVKVMPITSNGSFGDVYRFQDVATYYLGLVKTADTHKDANNKDVPDTVSNWKTIGLEGKQFQHPFTSWGLVTTKSRASHIVDKNAKNYDYIQFGSSSFASVTQRALKLSLDKTSMTINTASSVVATVKNSDGDYAQGAKVWLIQDGVILKEVLADAKGEAKFDNITVRRDSDVKVKAWYEYTDKLVTDPSTIYFDRDLNNKYFSAADAFAEATITVGDQEKLNLNLSPAEIYAGRGKDTPVTLTLTNDGEAAVDSNTITSYKFSISGLNQKLIDVITEDTNHKINGSLVEVNKWTDTTLTFDPETMGKITINVTARYKDGSEASKSVELNVKGYNVTVSGTDAYAGDTKKLSVTVMDGTTPINNAYVLVKATPKVSGSNNEYLQWVDKDSITHKGNVIKVSAEDFNINNGIYALDIKYLRASDINVYVYKDAFPADGDINADNLTPNSYAHSKYTVYGQPAYTVTPNVTTIVAGVKDTLKFSLKDANGNDISNATVEVAGVKDANTKDADIEFTNNGTSTSNGVTTYTLSNIIAHKVGSFKVVAYEPSTASVMGTFTFNAVAPKLDGAVKVTDGFKALIDIKVVDPRNNSPITGKLNITFDGADVKKIWNNQDNLQVSPDAGKDFIADDKAKYTFDSNASEFKLYVLATDRKEDGEAIAPVMILNFNKDYDSVEIARVPFGAATITSDPSTLTADVATTMNISLKDANGVGIADKNVAVMGTDIGTTDTDGKITYVFKPVTYGNVNITATNDLDKTITGKVTVGADSTAPEVTIEVPATVKTDTITITGTVKDDVKVQSVYINNRQVMVVPSKVSMFDYEMTLKPGANVIKVFAFDAAGNAGSVTKTVNYVLPTVVKMAVGSADATINGQAATGAASYIKAGSTMVPFRFIAEALGATVDYNATTSTVTMTLEGNTVVLTIGSTTAMVNGAAKTLTVAPEINNGRTMVPLRFVSEALGANVDWNAATSGITITR